MRSVERSIQGRKTKNWTVRISVNAEDVIYRDFRASSAEEAVLQAAESAVEWEAERREKSGYIGHYGGLPDRGW